MMREQIEAMQAIWTEAKPEYHGELVNFPPMMTWPKPVQKPHPPVIVGGVFPHAARRALALRRRLGPASRRPHTATSTDYLPQFRQMAAEAGPRPGRRCRSPCSGRPARRRPVKRYRDEGVARRRRRLPPEPADKTLPILDRWAEIIRKVNG